MNNNNSHQSNVNFTDLPEDIWLKIIKICEPDLLYSMYWVNKLLQQRIRNKKLLPLCICLVLDPPYKWECNCKEPESCPKIFLCHHKLLQENKCYRLVFQTRRAFLNPFKHPHESLFMINMLEIDTRIFRPRDSYRSISRAMHGFPNIEMLSLTNLMITEKFSKLYFNNHSLRYLSLRGGILSSSMDFSTCSFVEFSLNNVGCKNRASITMPDCLEKCELCCYLIEVKVSLSYPVIFQMGHCKKLKKL
jgi:hypothetical protein